MLSAFRAGSTRPARFQLKRVDGTPVQANNLPLLAIRISQFAWR